MKNIKQLTNNDCLFACFRYVCLKMHDKDIDYSNIIKDLHIGRDGIDLETGEEYAKYFGLECNSYFVNNLYEIKKNNILLIKKHNMQHYVVFVKNKKGIITYFDPSTGYIKIKENEFKQIFFGVVIISDKSKISKYISLNDNYLDVDKNILIKSIGIGLIIIILQLLVIAYFQLNLKYVAVIKDFKLMLISFFITSLFIISNSVIALLFDYYKSRIYQRKFLNELNVFLNKIKILDFKKGELHNYVSNISTKTNYFILFNTSLFISCFALILFTIIGFVINEFITVVIILLCICKVALIDMLSKKSEAIESEQMNNALELNSWLNNLSNDKKKIINHNEWNWFYKKICKRFITFTSYESNKILKLKPQLLSFSVIDKLADSILILIGIYLVINNSIEITEILLFSFIYSQISRYLVVIYDYRKSLISNKLAQINLSKLPDIVEEDKHKIDCIKQIDIVDFTLNKLFKPINASISSWVDIKGINGVGKSRLVNMIKNNYFKLNGILINGYENYLLDNDSLNKIIIISNDDQLYNEPINKQVLIDVSNKFEVDYCELMNIQSTKTICNEGDNVSSGQRQIINIVKCLQKDFDVLIIDEALTNIDERFKNYLLRLIKKICKDKILINVSHDFTISENIIEVKRWNT